MSTPAFDPVAVARQFLFVREAQDIGQNRGARVEAIQHWSLGQTGDSWCCEFATMVLDIAYQGTSPIGRLQACEDVHSLALEKHWLTTAPVSGDLFLYVTPEGHAHHIGFVTGDGIGLAGNTSPDGASSDGDGVYEHAVRTAATGGVLYVHYQS